MEDKFKWPPNMVPQTASDWAEIQEIEKDILLLYHQISEWKYIMGDFDYGSVYRLPYWDYLHCHGLDPERREFIQVGCLVMLLAMAWDRIHGTGTYLDQFIDKVKAKLKTLRFDDEKRSKLLKTVRLAVELADKGKIETDELVELSMWVYNEYVLGYFRRMAG